MAAGHPLRDDIEQGVFGLQIQSVVRKGESGQPVDRRILDGVIEVEPVVFGKSGIGGNAK